MSQTRGSGWLSYIGVMIGVVCLAGMLYAQTPTPYAVTYYNNSNPVPDSTFHIVNPGYDVTTLDPNGKPTSGYLCAMIYVFNNDEQLEECCGCLLTADSEITLSLNKDLLKNPVNGVNVTQHGVVKIISATENNAPCDPTADVNPITPVTELQAWGTHTLKFGSVYPEAEERFQYATLQTFELDFDEYLCSTIYTEGSNKGICTCGYGD